MAGLGAYMAAGAAGGLGQAMVDRAKALAAAALAADERAQKQADREQDHQWRLDEIDARNAYRTGGRSTGGSRRSSGLAAATGLVARTQDGGAVRTSPTDKLPKDSASVEITSKADADYPLYNKEPEADVSGLPRKAGPNEKVVNRFKAEDGSWRAFTSNGNEEVLLSGPTKSVGPDPDTIGEELTGEIRGEDGYLYGRTKSGKVKPYLDESGKKVKPAKASGEEEAEDPALATLDEALRGADPAVAAEARARVAAKVADGVAEPQAVLDVIQTLDRPTEVTNPAGTMLSRATGWTPKDAPPDETKVLPAKGFKTTKGGETVEKPVTNNPAAPRDPALRIVGNVYTAPDGRTVRWTGQGWELLGG